MSVPTFLNLATAVAEILAQGSGAAPASQIVRVITKLADSGLLHIPKNFDAFGVFDRVVTSVLEQTMKQSEWLHETFGLPRDTVLDPEFVAKLLRSCLAGFGNERSVRPVFDPELHGLVNVEDMSPQMREMIGDGSRWLRVFVPDLMPWPTSGLLEGEARRLFQEACVAWQSVVGVRFRFVHREEIANVIVRVAPIDGTGGELANATVGDGSGSPLRYVMTFDDQEEWTPAKFKFTCEHEIGHMLGLSHSHTPGTLMEAVVQLGADGNPAIDGPQPEDIESAKRLWGEPVL